MTETARVKAKRRKKKPELRGIKEEESDNVEIRVRGRERSMEKQMGKKLSGAKTQNMDLVSQKFFLSFANTIQPLNSIEVVSSSPN